MVTSPTKQGKLIFSILLGFVSHSSLNEAVRQWCRWGSYVAVSYEVQVKWKWKDIRLMLLFL